MSNKITQFDKGSMRRVLGLRDVFAIGYGDLGSSIYYALGITALYALGATPIALLLAGFIFACTALTYAEMTSVLQEAGGTASFSRKAFNDLISFIAGWGLLLDYIVTIAISAYSVGPYLAYFVPSLKIIPIKIAFASFVILSLVWLNIIGNKHSTRLSWWLTSLTLITQFVIVVIGLLTVVNFTQFFSHLAIGGTDVVWSPSWGQFMHGFGVAMVAYTGIESMAQLSAEAKTPEKTVPRAIMCAMVILLLMYIGISTVALSTLLPSQLGTTYVEDPIAGIVSVLPWGKHVLGPWIGLLGAVILTVASNAGLIGASRLSHNMSEYFQLPRFFETLHPKYKTPYTALIIFALAAIIIILWSYGSLDFLVNLYNFGAMLAFCSAHISLIMHRIRFPDVERPFRIPFNIKFGKAHIPITAIIGALATAAVWFSVVINKPDGRMLGSAWMAVGIVMYLLYRRHVQISPTGQIEIEKIRFEDFKDIPIKKILLPIRGHLSNDTILIGCNLAKAYNAELIVVNIVEIPFIMPMNTSLLQRETYSEAVVNRAQAIGIEKGIRMTLKTVRARSVVKSILDLIEEEKCDLVILGARGHNNLGPVTSGVLQKAKSRVWICHPSEEGNLSKDTISHLYGKHEKENPPSP